MDGSSSERDPAPVAGLFQSLNSFVATLLAIAHTRLQLLTTELQEEVQEVAQLLIWSFIALFAGMMALLLGALTVIFLFWETHRILAASLTTATFLLIAAGATFILKRRMSAKPPMLDATLAELARDRDELRARQ